MKTLKNIARFTFMTFTTAVTIFFFFIVLCRTDLVFDLFNSKTVLLVLGLTVGLVVGLLVGFIATYIHFAKILEEKNAEVKQLKKDLKEAKRVVSRLLPEVKQARQFNSNKSAEEAKLDANKRAKEVFSEICDLSETGNPEEVDADVDDEEFDTQDDMSSDET